MKKQLLILSMFLLGITHLSAQIEQKQSILNLGLGLGSAYNAGYTNTLPPIDASYEYMVSDAISVGSFVGLANYEIEFTAFNETDSINFFNLGAVGNYHLVNNETWDVYGGLRLGYLSVSYDAEDDPIFGNNDIRSSGIAFGAQIGARYFISPSFALNSELGINLAILKIGISYIF